MCTRVHTFKHFNLNTKHILASNQHGFHAFTRVAIKIIFLLLADFGRCLIATKGVNIGEVARWERRRRAIPLVASTPRERIIRALKLSFHL